MKILITGGTGFIGQTLCKRLLAQNHDLTVLSRKPHKVKTLCGQSVTPLENLETLSPDISFDAIINLAGEGIVDALWTKKRKQKLIDSRIGITNQLVSYINSAKHKPSVMISGSAIGIYGKHYDKQQAINNDPDDFAQQLCLQWEAAAKEVESLGVRLCLLRIGLVLGKNGGLLKRMKLPFKLGLGGRLGHGHQWMSWIHEEDLINIIETLLIEENLQGHFNGVSPNPVTNAEFTSRLAKQLRRPAIFHVPELILKLLLGEMSELLTTGPCVIPDENLNEFYNFKYEKLDTALRSILFN